MRVLGLPGSLPERSALESHKYQHPLLGSSDHLHHLGASGSCSCWRYKYNHADKLRSSLPLSTPCARPTRESVSRSVFIHLIDMAPLSRGVHLRSAMISPKTYASLTKGLRWQAASGEWRLQPLSIDLYWEIVRTQYAMSTLFLPHAVSYTMHTSFLQLAGRMRIPAGSSERIRL